VCYFIVYKNVLCRDGCVVTLAFSRDDCNVAEAFFRDDPRSFHRLVVDVVVFAIDGWVVTGDGAVSPNG
jgi:hypothetical protein